MVPADGGTSDGAHYAVVLCFVPCFLFPTWTYLTQSKIRHTAERKNYEDETRHPSTGGTDGGAGC